MNEWALELQSFFKTYKPEKTGRPIGFADKGLYVAAVVSFLNHYLPREVDYPFKVEPTVEELQRSQKTAMSFDEVGHLYNAAQKPRDRAMVLMMSFR